MWRSIAGSSGNSSSNGIVRRLVSLPRNILDGFSRGIDDLMSIGGRRNDRYAPSTFPFQQPSNFVYGYPIRCHPYYPEYPPVQDDYFAFLERFEAQYGTVHPFFYACRFLDALKIAENEQKFVFLYLNSPDHPFTASFCRETLSSELVVEFLDANFVSWAAAANGREGLNLAAALTVTRFPFCAVVAPAAAGETMAVLRQIEGPVSPAELVEILQTTMEEQGSAFGNACRVREEERRIADRRLREEQDAAYLAALRIDQEKEKPNKSDLKQRVTERLESSGSNQEKLKQNPSMQQINKVKEANKTGGEMLQKDHARGGKDVPVTQIVIRFPNGERREHTFFCTDKIEAIFEYINSLGLPGIGNYRLISNFPKRVYGVDQMGMALKDAGGLHPKASLFVELS